MGDRLATIDMGRKVGNCCAPFRGGVGLHLTECRWAEAYLRTKWYLDPSNRLATIHQRYRQTGQTGQRSRRVRRTVTCNGRPKTAMDTEILQQSHP